MTEAPYQLTLIAEISAVLRTERSLANGYSWHVATLDDVPALADLYFAAYNRDTVEDPTAAREEIEATFTGEYGRLDLAACPIVTFSDEAVAAAMTVDHAPWPDVSPGPFVVELMVRPDHRRHGLAEFAMQRAALRLAERNERTMGLRVLSDNAGARALYDKLGFGPQEEVR